MVLQEFSDCTNQKIINTPTHLENSDFALIRIFVKELKIINANKNRNAEGKKRSLLRLLLAFKQI
jgi:hypothetical protein